MRHFLQIYAKIEKQVRELYMVDGCERIQLVNTGNGIGVFDLRQPGVGNLELRVLFFFRNSQAQALHIPRRNAQADAQSSQLVSRSAETHRVLSYRIRSESVRSLQQRYVA
jgi:hypothetical protein